ncbi:hypothetical protein CASFOL_001191 [Castilleja foliolosa]|uniref:Uncharacterized protein n=1 Tax=Castilleja foliolosa TaxID=1961234 RepID=A0ABD3EQR0_9LAMI
MFRSYKSNESSSSSYYNRDSITPMDEYLERITRMQRTPTLIVDYPNFPNVHEILNNSTHVEKHGDGQEKKTKHQKKVQIVEPEKKAEAVKDGKIEIFPGKTIDNRAAGFINWNHNNFALCKWDTFKD